MTDPAVNIVALHDLERSAVWSLIDAVLTEQANKALVPTSVTGTLDEIAIATISRSATYQALVWARDRMIGEMIERERKAVDE